MKGNKFFKTSFIISGMGIGLLSLSLLCINFTSVSTKVKNVCGGYVFKDFDVVNDAVTGIQCALNSGTKPWKIKRTYDFCADNNTISVETKSYYAEYRKKPKYEKTVMQTGMFALANGHDAKVEFVYNKGDKKHITQINKKVKNRPFKTKKIAFINHGILRSA